ncbi:MAG: tetratricopeptide repeat protein [Candidatus Heimdallarchaeota archaeon]|nr:tetratricopeptide repeat protein [Candidatus Heimdallarchaeota archaeon]
MIVLDRAELLHIKELIIRGQYQDARFLLKSLKKMDRKLTIDEKNISLLLEGITELNLGEYKKSTRIAKQLLSKGQRKNDSILFLETINLLLKILDIQGKVQEGLDWIEIGSIHYKQLAEQEREELKLLLAEFSMNKGIFSFHTGNFVDSWVNLNEALLLAENYQINPTKADILNNIALHYANRGKLDLAVEANHQSLAIWEKIENNLTIAKIKNDLAEILIQQGDIHLALETFEREIHIVEKSQDKNLLASYQFNIGLINLEKGLFKQALDFFLMSLKNYQIIENNRKIACTIYYIIEAYVKQNEDSEAQRFLKQLEELVEKHSTPVIRQWFLLAKTTILNQNHRLKDLGTVEEILTDLVQQQEYDQKITIITLLKLSKLHLDYLMKTENKIVLEEVEHNLIKLEEIAELQDSGIIFIETYILQAHLAILAKDIQKAQELLTQARSLAQLKELDCLAMEVQNIYNIIITKVELWEKLTRYNSSLTELLEVTPFEEGLKQIARERITKKTMEQTEDPILILIQDPGGTSMYSKKFLPNSEFDEQLVSAFLFAINEFMQETFAGKGSIERINYLDYTLLFQPVEPFLICYAYKGQTNTSQQNLDRFTEYLMNSKLIWESLIKYTQTGLVPDIEYLISLENLVDEIFSPQTQDLTNVLDEDYIRENLDDILNSKL